MILVQYKGEDQRFAPEQISSILLARMKRNAESYLGVSVTEAVITVPAKYNDAQKQATKEAATIAGLNVKRILNEPTASALAYGFEKQFSPKEINFGV